MSILRLSGVVQVVDGMLRVRNQIYARVFDRRWIKANLPGEEMRRQQAAYRRGLLRAALIAIIILTAVCALAFQAVRLRAEAVTERDTAQQARRKAGISEAKAKTAATDAVTERNKAQRSEAKEKVAEARARRAASDAVVARNQAQSAATLAQLSAANERLAKQQAERATQFEQGARAQVLAQQPGQEINSLTMAKPFKWTFDGKPLVP